MVRQYSRDKWEKYWKQKMGINGYFGIEIISVKLSPGTHFRTLLNHYLYGIS